MCRRLSLQYFWIVLVLNWRCGGVLADPFEPPTFTPIEAKANGKMDPMSLEIFSSTFLDEDFPKSSTELDKMDFFEGDYLQFRRKVFGDDVLLPSAPLEDSSGDMEEAFESRGNSGLGAMDFSVPNGRKPYSVESKNPQTIHTTKRSILDFTTENLAFMGATVGAGKSLFSDIDVAGSDAVAELLGPSLTGEGADAKDVDMLEKGRNRKDRKDDISSESQILDHVNVVTEISVQETVGGRTIQRKPTDEELRLVQTKLLTSQDKNTASTQINISDVEDLASFLKTDPAFVDDDTDELFSDWGGADDEDDDNGYHDVNDMEAILKENEEEFDNRNLKDAAAAAAAAEEEFENRNENQNHQEEKSGQKDQKEKGPGDYRKVYHTERQNFSNVKEVKIVINETEGDFFDDDFSIPKSTAKKENTTKSHITLTENNDNSSTLDYITTERPLVPTTQRSSPSVEASVKVQRNETTKATTPAAASLDQAGSVTETLADNGISLKDFSEIISLVEKSFHELKSADDFSLNKVSDTSSDSSIELLRNITSNLADKAEAITSTTTEAISTIPADTSTVKIDAETEATVSITKELDTTSSSSSPELNTVATKLNNVLSARFGLVEEATETSTLTTTDEETATTTTASVNNKADGTSEAITEASTTSSTSNTKDTKGEATEHEMTASEVESILNAKLVNNNDDDDDDDSDEEKHHVLGDDGQRVYRSPMLKAKILNNSAAFNVKISQRENTFYIPESAFVINQGDMVNITWKAKGNRNHSLAMKVFDNDHFYVIKEIILKVFKGNKLVTLQKPIAFNPDPSLDDTMPGRTRVVMMRDGTYVTFSNVDFLKKDALNMIRENPDAATRDPKLWHFEVASICIATVVVAAIVLYVIAIKTKTKITLREKDELAQATHC